MKMKMKMTLPDPNIPLVPISKPVCFKGPGLGQLWAQGFLSSMSADGWDCVPILLVDLYEVFSTGAYRQLGGARS